MSIQSTGSVSDRDEMIRHVLSCLLDHYLCSYDHNKDALAQCAMLLVPDWEARWEEFNPALALHDLQSLGDRSDEPARTADHMNSEIKGE